MRWLALFFCATSAFAQPIEYPQFQGTIHFTAPNPPEFTTFLDNNRDKVVFLNILFTTDFGNENDYKVEEVCNSHFSFWDEGMEDQNIFLPIYEPEPSNPPKQYDLSDIGCEALPIRIVDSGLTLSSGGPGVHWFDIEGFFLIRHQSDRWPYIELKELPASAETWASIKNQ